jgi:hypothetical protein
MADEQQHPGVTALRPRSILLAAAILDLVDLTRMREPNLDAEDVLEALNLTREEVLGLLDETDWH